MSHRWKFFFAYFWCLTPERFLNYVKLQLGYVFSLVTGRTALWANPFAVTFENVSGCNLKCPGCEVGAGMINRSPGTMNVQLFEIILRKLPASVFHINLYAQGEPLLHKDIERFIYLCRQKNLFVSLSTNGLLLNHSICESLIRAGLTHIIISLDGFDQHSYEQYRIGGAFSQLVENTQNLIRMKKQSGKLFPIVEIQTVVTKYNEAKLPSIRHIAKTIGADKYSIKTAYVPNLSSVPDYLPLNKKYLRYNVSDKGMLHRTKHAPRSCFRLRSSFVIQNNFNVVPCCFDKNGQWILGNLQNQKFHEIWKNKKHLELLQVILSGKQPEMCFNCI